VPIAFIYMQFQIFQDNQKGQWNDFIKANALDGGLLQSWQWGDFKKSLGHQVWRVGLVDQGQILIASQLIRHKKLAFNFLYSPRGLVISKEVMRQMKIKEVLGQFLIEIKDLAKKQKAIFLRVDPAWPRTSPRLLPDPGRGKSGDVLPEKFLTEAGFKSIENLIQPIHTLILDLTKNSEELLAQTHHKTRYNIGLAERKGLTVKADHNQLDVFYNLLSKTKERQAIGIHSKKYYQKMTEVLAPEKMLNIFTAEFQGKNLAAILVAYFNQTAYYLHGGSDPAFRQLMAPHLLQWTAIQEAQKNGYKFYDFWGVAPDVVKIKREENWRGITRFKRGFAPAAPIVEYAGLFELAYRPRLYKWI